ncbi:MAG: hypothetical protein LBV12_03000 [Puniceicoccales bacterium]|jgi:hypothetical protein|nr:hypothetical protein [Puniceicoccales bacterium]
MKTFRISRIFLVVTSLAFGVVGLDAQTFYFGRDGWEINSPFAPKGTPLDSKKANIRGTQITRTVVIGPSIAEQSKRFSEVTRIEWGIRPQAMEDAEAEIQRGEGAKALALIEPVVQFFAPFKKTPGTLWLRAASIKLDALVLLKNDAVIESFIRELEEINDGSIPGLEQRISLAKLDQLLRKGNPTLVLTETDKLIRDTTDLGMIANLHVIKGNALLQLRRYEEAMNTFLRVPVFYGSQSRYIPSALLGAAKAFRGMDSPANRHLQLESVSNGYLTEIISQYPLSKEAEEAKAMLPKDVREEVDSKPLVETETTSEETTAPAKTEEEPGNEE